MEEAIDLAAEIVAKSPLTLKIGKQAFYAQAELGLAAAYDYASQVMTDNMMALDARKFMIASPHMFWAPTIALSLVIFGVNMFGDAMRCTTRRTLKRGRTTPTSAVRDGSWP